MKYTLLLICISVASQSLLGQAYQVGDVVDDYTLIDYRTGESTSLYELGSEGGVLVLEWFAWWCPFCARASENIETGIIEHYMATGGNPHGVPVKHIGLNVQGNARGNSDVFIEKYGFGTVVEDYQRDYFHHFNTASTGQPLFVIINAEPNSPTAEQWEVLYMRLNYFNNEAPDMTALMRPVIDAVQAGMTNDPFKEQFDNLEGPLDGWYQSPWFGWFQDEGYPLINHVELGYGYLAPAAGEHNVHFLDLDLGWVFTGKQFYPFLFCYKSGNWLLYLEGSSGQWFYDYSVNEWLEASQVGS